MKNNTENKETQRPRNWIEERVNCSSNIQGNGRKKHKTARFDRVFILEEEAATVPALSPLVDLLVDVVGGFVLAAFAEAAKAVVT